MPAELFQRHRVVDVDTHLTEPPNLWTSRVSSKWGEAVPHVENVRGTDNWVAGGNFLNTPGSTAIAGWNGYVPDGPKTYDEIPPSAYDASARLAHMDDEGIYARGAVKAALWGRGKGPGLFDMMDVLGIDSAGPKA